MFFVLAAGVLTALAVIYLIGRFPDAVEGEGGINLVRSLAVLAFLGATAILHRRAMKTSLVFLSILAWLAVGVVLFTGYSYRYELSQIGDRLLGELIPSGGIEVTGGAVSIRVNKSGHFVVEAVVDGVSVRFLVDTGASDVILSPGDAARLGFDVKTLAFTRPYQTANGLVFGAPVRLGLLSIGPITMTGVRASVNGAPMKRSLLGMSFLGRLSGYDVSRETMILRP
jgi:aspartyl protease family protein